MFISNVLNVLIDTLRSLERMSSFYDVLFHIFRVRTGLRCHRER